MIVQTCFGDTNGFVDWISISGGEPFEPCEGDNNSAAIENFTLSCSDLTATFDCDFTYILTFLWEICVLKVVVTVRIYYLDMRSL